MTGLMADVFLPELLSEISPATVLIALVGAGREYVSARADIRRWRSGGYDHVFSPRTADCGTALTGTVFVSYSTGEDLIREFFAKCGELIVVTDRSSGYAALALRHFSGSLKIVEKSGSVYEFPGQQAAPGVL